MIHPVHAFTSHGITTCGVRITSRPWMPARTPGYPPWGWRINVDTEAPNKPVTCHNCLKSLRRIAAELSHRIGWKIESP